VFLCGCSSESLCLRVKFPVLSPARISILRDDGDAALFEVPAGFKQVEADIKKMK
jgi:hypothetical protein